ncbi:polypeptide N-acetylgalactosaminyltransferase 6-like [Mya arenaria]|uniref:polypeptide N-acetylgalactosaminyltransferase 6-like n=1 Tax=Mya arenaria TaxID=6604 RepID=UPI0022E3110D|nr:polypeptide N-acetylgalactosaminyltransferase 6-like [Mya arenaria]
MGAKVVVGNLTEGTEYIKRRNESLKYGMNIFVSDLIGFRRTLADRRPQTCKMIVYPDNLPTVSIIIIFRDEPLSTLMRTVYGVFDTCPKELLQEVILVDDGTVDRRTILGVQIHVRNMDKAILIRNEKSRGLMMARQQGIERARSGHFIVLDSHIEFNIGWLEPILHRLVEEPTALLTSHVGVIDMDTFEYVIGEWNTQFMCFEQISANDQWTFYSDEFILKRNGSVAPIEYCTVPGMMMAMTKYFFLQLGGFDPGMEVWGSENTEISVKTWLCGGRVEMVPCSKIAHLYRITPWQGVEKRSTYLFKNKLRFASVWTDGIIQKIMLDNLKSGEPEVDYGDVSARKQIREVNECKKYKYFVNKIKEISHEVYFPQNPQRYGPIVNKSNNKCIDCANLQDSKTQTLILYACTTGGNQYFLVSEDGRMKNKASWIMADYAGTLFIAQNPRNWWRNPENQWTLLPNGVIMHNVTGKCLDYDEKEHITLNLCDDRRPQQIWEWPLFNT